MTPRNMFTILENRFNTRRSKWPHKRLRGTALWVITNPDNDPNSLCIESCSNFEQNRRAAPEKQTPPLARIYRDGRIIFAPPSQRYLPCSVNSVLKILTDDALAIHRNSSRMTNATHIVVPAMEWVRGTPTSLQSGYMMPGWTHPGTYGQALKEQKRVAKPIFVGFETVHPYRIDSVRSLEPVRKREWDPEKRKEYLRMRKAMTKQVRLRAYVGALDAALSEWQHGPIDGLDKLWETRAEWNKRILDDLSPEEQENFAMLAKAAVWKMPWRDRTALLNGNRVDPEIVIAAIKRLLATDSETLRLKMGAVVYTLESVSQSSPDDQNVVVQPSDSLRAVPPAS